jgi:hypothetical protein
LFLKIILDPNEVYFGFRIVSALIRCPYFSFELVQNQNEGQSAPSIVLH